jgi:hypothetical protein
VGKGVKEELREELEAKKTRLSEESERPASTRNMGAEPFRVKGCALPAIATGEHAQNLRELREYLTVMVAITHRLQDRGELK